MTKDRCAVLVLAFVCVAGLAASCGGSSSTPPAPTTPTPAPTSPAPAYPVPTTTPNIGGSWVGTIAGSAAGVGWDWGPMKMKAELAQSGDKVSGTWADTMSVEWKGTIAGRFNSPGSLTATVTFTAPPRWHGDTCQGTGTFTWDWDTATGTAPMVWKGGFTWTSGDCGPFAGPGCPGATCGCPNGICPGYPDKVSWYLNRP